MGGVAELLGRDDERTQLGLLLGNTRNGRGGSVLLVGEPGIGKTALLEAATSNAAGVSILRFDGFESESTIPFAAVQRLVIPLREHLGELQERQRQAIEVASGVADGPPPDRFLVGLGVLSLLAAAATKTSLVCTVDDAHLLDQESLDVLAFVARRLAVEPVALLFAARDEAGVADHFGGVPLLALGGLDIESAVALLRRSLPEAIDPAAATTIARATGGNPLALIDLAQDLSTRELSSLVGEDPIPVGRHLEEHYARRARQADGLVQDGLLLAAADSSGNVDLLTGAANELGLADEVLDRAESTGLVELRKIVRFRHPLVRSAVYNASSGADRRRIHRALAAAAARLGLVEVEAWHAARAIIGTDPAVADRLEHAADLAAKRGGFASRARVLARAAELTPPGPARDARQVAAAEAALAVGAAQVAHKLIADISEDAVDPVTRGRMIVVRCALGTFTADPAVLRHASARQLDAAIAFHGREPKLEQRALLKAFESAQNAERLMQGVTVTELGERISAGALLSHGPTSVILRGIAALIRLPYDQAVVPVRAAFDEIMRLPEHEGMEMGSAVTALAVFLWDDAGREAALNRASLAARDSGALQALDTLLWIMALSELSGGSVRRAEHYNELVREVRRAMGYDAENVINAAVMAWTGSPRQVVLAIADGANALGFGGVASSTFAAVAVTELAEGSYRAAYERLKPLIKEPFLHVTPTYYPDYVEAARRSGHADEALRCARTLASLADLNGSPWCRGVAERSLALTCADQDAEPHFRAAIDALASTRAEVELARAHLVCGEWLRRTKRRREAGEQLRQALNHFERSGADVFIPRTRAELEATGGKAHPPRQHGGPDLTTQEATIARLAATGHTNPEIAANLFISPNTVDYHLRKVFQKFGISSRRQLADKLHAGEP